MGDMLYERLSEEIQEALNNLRAALPDDMYLQLKRRPAGKHPISAKARANIRAGQKIRRQREKNANFFRKE